MPILEINAAEQTNEATLKRAAVAGPESAH